MEELKIYEKPEVIKSNKQIISEWRKKFKETFETIKKDNLSLSQFKPCYEELMTGIINDFFSLDEKIYYLKELYNSHSYLEDENLPKEKMKEKEQYDTCKEIICEKLDELIKEKLLHESKENGIDEIELYNRYIESIDQLLNKKRTIRMPEYIEQYNRFKRSSIIDVDGIDYIRWAEKLIDLGKVCIPTTWNELNEYTNKLTKYIDKNKGNKKQ